VTGRREKRGAEASREALERLVGDFGLTQGDVARLLGLPDPDRGGKVTVHKWLRGKAAPPSYLPLALAAVRARLEEAKEAGRDWRELSWADEATGSR
jgi:transcriptional regulator with XRE-family HTH domain